MVDKQKAPRGSGTITCRSGRFCAKIYVDGKKRSVGTFATREEAIAAIDVAKGRIATGKTIARNAASFVYFIQDGVAGPIKIGRAKDPAARLYEMQTGSPGRRMRLLATMPGGARVEAAMHTAFAGARMNGSGEWFEPTHGLVALIDELEAIVGRPPSDAAPKKKRRST